MGNIMSKVDGPEDGKRFRSKSCNTHKPSWDTYGIYFAINGHLGKILQFPNLNVPGILGVPLLDDNLG